MSNEVYTWKSVQALAHIAAINARIQEGRRAMGTAGVLTGQLASFLRVDDQTDQNNITLLNQRIRTLTMMFSEVESLLVDMTNREVAIPHVTVERLQTVINGDPWGPHSDGEGDNVR